MLLNADVKFNRYIKDYGLESLHPDIQQVVKATLELVDLIYTDIDGASMTVRGSIVKNNSGSRIIAEMRNREPPEILTRQRGAYSKSPRAEHGSYHWTEDLAAHPNRPSSALSLFLTKKHLTLITQCENYTINCPTKR